MNRIPGQRHLRHGPAILVAALACAAQAPAAITNLATGAVAPIGAANSFKPMELVRPGPPGGGGPAIEYRMMWPLAGEPPEALDAVRSEIWTLWSASGDPPAADGFPADVDTAMRTLADAFAATRTAAESCTPGGGGGRWIDRRKVDAVGRMGGVLSVTILREQAMGGATVRRIDHRVFDHRNGRLLRAADWFRDDADDELIRRLASAIPTGHSPSDEPVRADNFAIRPDGIHFTFNRDEPAPAATDPVNLHFPFDALRDLFRPEAAALLPE